MKKTIVLFGWMAAVLCGCVNSQVKTVSLAEFKQVAERASVQQAVKLVPGDTIEVSVEVDGSMEVSQHNAGINHMGYVILPLVGDVRVGGLRLDEARWMIAKAYGNYFVSKPVIMVDMVGGAEGGEWGYVRVMGHVSKPGRIPLGDADGMTLSEAIQAAGGFDVGAKQSEVRVSRSNSAGEKVQVSVDFREIGEGGNADADVSLIDGDVVYVPQRVI